MSSSSSRSIFDMSKSEAESASARPTRAEVAQGPLLDGPWAGSRCPGQRHGLQAAHGLVRVGTLQQGLHPVRVVLPGGRLNDAEHLLHLRLAGEDLLRDVPVARAPVTADVRTMARNSGGPVWT
ncbi:hypothetical protein [Streptomyces clavifer]|uniref:hypothetical protein n=1 Tax=Streptomyces clavifer TaxID=68188 RepID=UPI002E7FC32F|nr:hypothetical protein [Streptomyces clavifer]WUC26621.1 hypothetical protein OG927_04245 [Streptomyces clavifer]